MGMWYNEAIFYHIYPLGLCGVPKENSEQTIGHQFEELAAWNVHIKNIGCNAIYIGPLFQSATHGYDTIDYKRVDQRLGTNEEFKDYVHKCHEAGIKIVVDGVFNHTGRGFFAFQDLLKKREQSSYKDWYCNVNFYQNNEYHDGFSYESWRGATILAKLNLRNEAVKKYFFDVISYWVEEFDIDGIRLDCADVLEFSFMHELRLLANKGKPDFWLMGEVIHGDYSRWVNDEMLHSVTNYELHKALYSAHNDHNYFEIAHNVKRLFDPNGGICKGKRLYSFIDNHDVERIISKLKDANQLVPILILLYTLPGIPSIYYGTEFLLTGKKDGTDWPLRPPLVRENYMSVKDGQIEYTAIVNQTIILLLQKLAHLRTTYHVFTYGEYKELLLTNRQYAFFIKGETEAIIVLVNNDEKQAFIKVPLKWNVEQVYDFFEEKRIKVKEGNILTDLNGCSGKIFIVNYNE